MGLAELKAARETKLAEVATIDQQIKAALPVEQVEDFPSVARIAWAVDDGGALVLRTVSSAQDFAHAPAAALRRIADIRDALDAWAAGGPWPASKNPPPPDPSSAPAPATTGDSSAELAAALRAQT